MLTECYSVEDIPGLVRKVNRRKNNKRIKTLDEENFSLRLYNVDINRGRIDFKVALEEIRNGSGSTYVAAIKLANTDYYAGCIKLPTEDYEEIYEDIEDAFKKGNYDLDIGLRSDGLLAINRINFHDIEIKSRQRRH